MTHVRRRRVIVGDDEAEVREVLVEYLTSLGYHAIEAANGLEVLLCVKQDQPHVVLLDLSMPRLGGIDALKRIRAFDASITVVIISASIADEIRRQALALGAVAVLDKPVDFAKLADALERQAPPPAQPAPAAPVTSIAVPSPAAPPMPAAAVPAPAPPAPGASSAPGTILVVDDDRDVRETLEEFVRMNGYEVRTAKDGAAGIRELVSSPSDIVLLDIDMPGLSGAQALPTIRAVAPDTAVIMVSGNPDETTAQSTLAAGAFDYVTKPVDPVRLMTVIQAARATQQLTGDSA